VDKRQRNGRVFKAHKDGMIMDADTHAALTIALWPILRLSESQQFG
jgi:hypothetical protein